MTQSIPECVEDINNRNRIEQQRIEVVQSVLLQLHQRDSAVQAMQQHMPTARLDLGPLPTSDAALLELIAPPAAEQTRRSPPRSQSPEVLLPAGPEASIPAPPERPLPRQEDAGSGIDMAAYRVLTAVSAGHVLDADIQSVVGLPPIRTMYALLWLIEHRHVTIKNVTNTSYGIVPLNLAMHRPLPPVSGEEAELNAVDALLTELIGPAKPPVTSTCAEVAAVQGAARTRRASREARRKDAEQTLRALAMEALVVLDTSAANRKYSYDVQREMEIAGGGTVKPRSAEKALSLLYFNQQPTAEPYVMRARDGQFYAYWLVQKIPDGHEHETREVIKARRKAKYAEKGQRLSPSP